MEPVRAKRWRFREVAEDDVRLLSERLGLSPLVARVMAARGVTAEDEAAVHLDPRLSSLPDPQGLSGSAEASRRLVEAARSGEIVCVHGDYDVDGMTATALLIQFFREVGISCYHHIPHRLEHGYGLSLPAVDEAHHRGASILLTVDCGITAVAEAQRCRQLGIDLIITDHHTPGHQLPEALAVIDPHLDGPLSPFRFLAGVGVAFMLVVSLRTALRGAGWFEGRPEPALRNLLDLVALGTVADVVPLLGLNRILVTHGLKELTAAKRPGIRALKEVAGVTGEVGAGAVGFRLAPRLNAAGRLDAAAPGVELLLETEPDQALQLARILDEGNGERQAVEREILREALALMGKTPGISRRRSIVLASEEWHPGVIGIVASRLVELYHRPTILISLAHGEGKGSGRSIPGFHLYQALDLCAQHLLRFGGHRQAAGLSIAPETLEAFVHHFEEVASGALSPEDLVPELLLDGRVHPDVISHQLVRDLGCLAPHGMGNPEPVFLLEGARVLSSRTVKGQHLKLAIQAGGLSFDAIGFNMAGIDGGSDQVDLAFTPELNRWNGRESIQLRLRGLRASGACPC